MKWIAATWVAFLCIILLLSFLSLRKWDGNDVCLCFTPLPPAVLLFEKPVAVKQNTSALLVAKLPLLRLFQPLELVGPLWKKKSGWLKSIQLLKATLLFSFLLVSFFSSSLHTLTLHSQKIVVVRISHLHYRKILKLSSFLL